MTTFRRLLLSCPTQIRASRVFGFPRFIKAKNTGFPLKTCGNDREKQRERHWIVCVRNPLPGQRSSGEHFVLAEGFECRDGNSGDGYGFTDSIEDFDGVSFCAIQGNMVVHQFDDVATTQPVFRQINGEGRLSLWVKLHRVFPLNHPVFFKQTGPQA